MAYPTSYPSPTPSTPVQFFIAIHLVLSRRMMVTHFDMDLNPSVPIKHLKEELVRQLGMPATVQQWYFRNTVLNEVFSLEQCGVIHDSIVEVRPKQAPSAAAATSPAELSVEASNLERS